MALKNALKSLRNQNYVSCRPEEASKIEKRPLATLQPSFSEAFHLEENGKDDFDLEFSDDEFFRDADLLNWTDATPPTSTQNSCVTSSVAVTSSQVTQAQTTSTPQAGNDTLHSTPRQFPSQCSQNHSLPVYKKTHQTSPTISSIQRLKTFQFHKQSSHNTTSEGNPPKRRALDSSETQTLQHTTARDNSTTPHSVSTSTKDGQVFSQTRPEIIPNTFSTPHSGSAASPRLVSPLTTPARASSSGCSSRDPSYKTGTPGSGAAVLTTPNRPPRSCPGVVTPMAGSVRRKFPGPAGALPKLTPGQSMDRVRIATHSVASPVSTPRTRRIALPSSDLPVASSQEQTPQEFSQGAWSTMTSDLDMNDPVSATLLQHNISSTIKQASQRKLSRGKVPFLAVMLKSIVPSARSASAVLKDPTDEMLATIHIKVVNKYQDRLVPGSVLVLQQVSVFSPTRHKHYLNITVDNVVRVYDDNSRNGQGKLRLSDYNFTLTASPVQQLTPTGRHVTTTDHTSGSATGTDQTTPHTSCSTPELDGDEFDDLFKEIDTSCLDL